MSRTIHLIVEDETDVEVVRALLATKNPALRIAPLKATGNSGGLSRLAIDLEKLINTAIQKRKKGACIVVLHDADKQIDLDQISHQKIAAICKSKEYRQDVKLIVAHDEIESWLLADEGLCKWLGIKAKNLDSIKQPSAELNSIAKEKKGKKFPLIRTQALTFVDGTGDKLSPSMQKAVAALVEADCLQA